MSDPMTERRPAHRDDDQPCGCDDCMDLLAEDAGINWSRLPIVERDRLRLESGDDRFLALLEHPATPEDKP